MQCDSVYLNNMMMMMTVRCLLVAILLSVIGSILKAQLYDTIYPDHKHVTYTGLFEIDGRVYRVGHEHVIEMSTDDGEDWVSLTPPVPVFNLLHVESTKSRAVALISPMRWAPDDWEDSTHTSVLLFTQEKVHPEVLQVPWFVPVKGLYRSLLCDITEDAIFISQAWEESAVIRSTDNGTTWTTIQTPDSLSENKYLDFYDKNHGFLIAGTPSSATGGGRALFLTTDAGFTWTHVSGIELPVPAIDDPRTPPIQWLSRDSVVLVDYLNRLLLSDDGGIHWSELSQNLGLPIITDVIMRRDGRGMLICEGGMIIKTNDYGRNSLKIRDRTYLIGDQVPHVCVTGNESILYGDDFGVTAHSTDGGLSWIEDTYQLYLSPRRLRVFSMDTLFACVYPTQEVDVKDWYITTSDGGDTWSDALNMRKRDWADVYYATRNTWYASRLSTPDDNSIVLKTTDAGYSWHTVLTGGVTTYMNSWRGVFSSGEDIFWFACSTGFMGTSDGGLTWSRIDPRPNSNFDRVGHVDISKYPECYCLMHDGFFRSVDGGLSWTKWPDTDRNWYVLNRNMIVTPDNHIYLQTYDGVNGSAKWKLYRSLDKGVSWDSIDVVQQQIKFSFISTDGQSTGYRDRYDGTYELVSTTNEWRSYTVEEYSTTAINEILFMDANNGFLATQFSILKTTNGGISWTNVTPSIPLSPRILSNWPQPVSQGEMMSTEVEITRPGPVKIELYDLLGRRRAVVFNAEVETARRTVQWSTAGLDRGVYILRLLTGSRATFSKVVVQ